LISVSSPASFGDTPCGAFRRADHGGMQVHDKTPSLQAGSLARYFG
jgi:hypothetical protein